jgi:AI-2 transport protein TqsA
MKSTNVAGNIIIVFAIVFILIIGRTLIFPLFFAFLLYFLVRYLTEFVDKVKFIRKSIPSGIKKLVMSLSIFIVIFFLGTFIIQHSQDLIVSFKTYQPNLLKMARNIDHQYGIDISDGMHKYLEEFNLGTWINPILNSVSSFLGSFLIMLFYLLFLFIEESTFKQKLILILPQAERYQKTKEILEDIENTITFYVGLKSFISALTTSICFIVLISFGVNSPLFWAFLMFVLNFIPIVGTALAVLLPSVFALIQFNDITITIIMFSILIVVKTIIANYVEPKVMGNSLNISPLVALFALSFWGSIWGVTGMIVSVPISVIIIILLSHIPSTKPIAVMLSQNGMVGMKKH